MSLLPIIPAGNGSQAINITGNAPSLLALATAAGWGNDTDIVFRVSGDVGGPITQDIDSGFVVRIVVQSGARVIGFGGGGRTPTEEPDGLFNLGEDGGNGIDVLHSCEIINNGLIAGGGQGGGAQDSFDGSGAYGGGGGGAGIPPGNGGGAFKGGLNGLDGTTLTGGAGGIGQGDGSNGGPGGDIGDSFAISGFADVTYTGTGTLIGGTD